LRRGRGKKKKKKKKRRGLEKGKEKKRKGEGPSPFEQFGPCRALRMLPRRNVSGKDKKKKKGGDQKSARANTAPKMERSPT